jgi:hypothetical protein
VERKQRGHDHDSGSGHTCCEVTGKYNVTVASSIPLAPPVLIATFVTSIASTGTQRGTRWFSPTVAVAHSPPSYLLQSALLI